MSGINQKNNVLEISKQAGALYDQFVNLTEDLIKKALSLSKKALPQWKYRK